MKEQVSRFTHHLSWWLSRKDVNSIAKPVSIIENDVPQDHQRTVFRIALQKTAFQFKPIESIPHLCGSISTTCALTCLRSHLLQCSRNASVNFSANLSKIQSKDFQVLVKKCMDGHFVMRKADKSRQIVIMTTAQYNTGVTQLLNDARNYKLIPFNLQMRTAARIRQVIYKYRAPLLLTTQQVDVLLSHTRKPKSRKFYALPKTHKPESKWKEGLPPFRPICPDLRTETSATAKLITQFLCPNFQNVQSYIKSSYTLIAQLKTLPTLPTNAVLIVADVDNLYPNIPLIEALLRVQSSINNSQSLEAQFILELLKVQLEENCFEYNGQFYKQLRGVPMGKAWAPAVASIYLDVWERAIFEHLKLQPIFYRRYIDDIFCIVSSREEAERLTTCMNVFDPNIKLSETIISTNVHFLDLQLYLNKGHIETSIYYKPTDLKISTHFHSAQSQSIKSSIILSQYIRIYRLSTDLHEAGIQMRTFAQLMMRLQKFPPRTLRQVWQKFKHWLHRQNNADGTNDSRNLRPPNLWLPNCTFLKPFRDTINVFKSALPTNDAARLKQVSVKCVSGRSIGVRCFKP
jgi:hypothetical protein